MSQKPQAVMVRNPTTAITIPTAAPSSGAMEARISTKKPAPKETQNMIKNVSPKFSLRGIDCADNFAVYDSIYSR
jgi:hypothetical protein